MLCAGTPQFFFQAIAGCAATLGSGEILCNGFDEFWSVFVYLRTSKCATTGESPLSSYPKGRLGRQL